MFFNLKKNWIENLIMIEWKRHTYKSKWNDREEKKRVIIDFIELKSEQQKNYIATRHFVYLPKPKTN